MPADKALIRAMGRDSHLKKLATDFLRETARFKYTYHFSWLGIPVIQLPQDILAMQEVIWKVKPDLVIETGIAHGGSLIFYASMLELIGGGRSQVLGVDINLRQENRLKIESHPLSKRIKMIEGSSADEHTARDVGKVARRKKRVLVALDSNHTHEHVLKELQLYSPMVTKGSYLIVFDTAIEDMPSSLYPNRPWGKGNNPKTAVQEFLRTTDRFEVDKEIESKLLITVAPGGYLKCVKD